MGIVDLKTEYRTMTCNSCNHTATFDKEKPNDVVKENPWLLGGRMVQTGDGRVFWYCADECEVKGVTTGNHNIPEEKKVISIADAGGNAAIRRAADAARQLEEANRAIRAGEPTKLSIQG